jgi:hypothetical protein
MKESPHFAGTPRRVPAQCNSAGSRSQRQAPLPLIQMGQQRGERLPEHHLGLFRHTEILRPQLPHQTRKLLIGGSLGL